MKNLNHLKPILIAAFAAALLCGCVSTINYPAYPSANWNGIKTLGTVTADSGAWPLSLNAPPPDYTYYSALCSKASEQFNVPKSQVVLGEVSVVYGSEMDGTIRDWKATAIAGQNTNAPIIQDAPSAPPAPENHWLGNLKSSRTQ
jgi:hypothetical protein